MEARLDSRFSDPSATATPWEETERALQAAELYWITTVRADGRPHVTPLIGIWFEGAMHFTTGLEEQKARNLASNPQVALTTGANTWAQGLDVVVEGSAVRVTDGAVLERLAAAIEEKYGAVWHFDVGDGVFEHRGGEAAVFRVEAAKVMAFAKDPHGQTSYRPRSTM
jgi:general stress protein 26